LGLRLLAGLAGLTLCTFTTLLTTRLLGAWLTWPAFTTLLAWLTWPSLTLLSTALLSCRRGAWLAGLTWPSLTLLSTSLLAGLAGLTWPAFTTLLLAWLAWPSLTTLLAVATWTAITTAITTFFAWRKSLLCSSFRQGIARFTTLSGENIASVNPHFDANDTKGCMSLSLTIVNISTQSLQRNFSFYLFL
jgi:hypothetical protein